MQTIVIICIELNRRLCGEKSYNSVGKIATVFLIHLTIIAVYLDK